MRRSPRTRRPSRRPPTRRTRGPAKTVTPADVTVTADAAPVEITVTNQTRRQLTPLRISKVLVGDTAGEPPGQTYDMSYSCIDGSGVTHEGSNSISAGESWTTATGRFRSAARAPSPRVTCRTSSPRNIWGPGRLRHHPRRRRAADGRSRTAHPRRPVPARSSSPRPRTTRSCTPGHQPPDPGGGWLPGRQDRRPAVRDHCRARRHGHVHSDGDADRDLAARTPSW